MTTGTASVTPDLIRYMANAAASPIPSPVLAKAKHHVLDTIAAMVSGTTIKPGAFALRYIEQQGGKPEAQVVGSGIVTSAINAALANGMLAHADETDDSNGSAGIHPGCAVVPAALAMAERVNADGEAFVRAVILGYDIGCRTTKALGRDALRARNHLPFSIGGTLGATAAAGCLARLSEEQIRHLLSCGAQQASGVMTYARDTEHIEKAFIFGGMPARNGVTAATLVQNGYTGVHDVFDGHGNFLAAFAESPRPQELVAELPLLRMPLGEAPPPLRGPVARRMAAACRPLRQHWITPMAAVAGAVADEILAAAMAGRRLRKLWVNDGGDIAFHLAPGAALDLGLVSDLERPFPRDRARMIKVVKAAGCRDLFDQVPYDRGWIYRSTHENVIVDLIWAMANQRTMVDETWVTRGTIVQMRDMQVRLLPIEELIWAKLYVIQRERCDWPDLLNVLRALDTEADRASGITFDGEAIWIASTYSREIIRADAMTCKTIARYFTPGAGVIYRMTGDPPVRTSPLASAVGTPLRQRQDAQQGEGQGQGPAPRVGGFHQGQVLGGQAPGTGAHGLEWRDGKLWVAVPPSRTIYRVNPKDWIVEHKFSTVGNRPHGIGWEGKYLWCTDSNLNAFFKHNVVNGEILEKIQLTDTDPLPHGMSIYEGILWYCDDVGVVCRLRL